LKKFIKFFDTELYTGLILKHGPNPTHRFEARFRTESTI